MAQKKKLLGYVKGGVGPKGDTGPYYTPSVNEQGELSWSGSTEDLPPIPQVSIKGDRGEQGPPGENATTTALASEEAPGLLRQLSGKDTQVLLGNGEWGEYHDDTALNEFKTQQETKDSDQDSKIKEAKDAADAAAKAIPPTVTSENAGIVPAFPSEGIAYLVVNTGKLGWQAIPVVTNDSNGLVPALPNDANKFLNGLGEWVEVKTGGAADPRELRALLAEATKLHDEAWSDSQSDPLLHSWKNTAEAITALQNVITEAKKVSDGFGTEYFLQSELDEARGKLQKAIETFKSTGTEVLPKLETFESLKARVEAVDSSTIASTDGKDVTFGQKYVLTSEKNAAKSAVDTCQTSINQATKQSQIDAATTTLTSAVTKYEGQVKTATANTAALDKAIEAANTAKTDVKVSTDGNDLPAGSNYVTDQAILDKITSAIETATSTKSSATTQKQLDDATSTLTKATEEFSAQVKQNISIYGVKFDNFPTTTKGTRTDGAANFGDVKPAVSNGSGSSPFDNIEPWKSMIPEDRTGGRMVPIKKFYYKLTQNGKGVNVQIASGKLDGYTISPAHMDRHDGKGEREVVYVGRYHCATSTYKSTTKVLPANNANKATMIQNIGKIGNTYHMMDFNTRFTLWLLYLVECAEWNSQKLIGFGTGNGSSVENMGYTDNMKYCTGTTQSNTTTQAIGTQYRNIEGLWDNVYDFLSGCYNDSKGLNIVSDTSKLGDSTGGKTIGLPVNGYPGELKVTETGGFPAFYPSTANGSDSTGTCDSWSFSSSSPVVYSGGNYVHSSYHGMFYLCCTVATSSYAYVGCRLLELP